ncbi:hypothetical protein ABPG73_015966 [Tetrahymena malaccensis]
MSQQESGETQTQKITNTRLMRERKEIDTVLQEYDVQWKESQKGVEVQFSFQINSDNKKDSVAHAEIKLEQNYPFSQPLIKFNLTPGQLALFNHDSYKEIDYYTNKTYTPKMTVADIIKLIAEYGKKNIQIGDKSNKETIFSLVHTLYSVLGSTSTITFIILFASFIRILAGIGPYSGYKDAPTYGDYEAQRHWMELTLHTPPSQWYVETLYNDLTYWRIDYPPLSAYVSYIFGYISHLFDPKSVELYHSRGYEEPNHKIYMRMTVLISDILFFFTSLYYVTKIEFNKYSFTLRSLFYLLALLCPPFILIDHAHFQYNSFMHGLVLWSVYFCSKGSVVIGGILFTLALNFKQMGLYYSLGFFFYILGYLAVDSGFRSIKTNKYNFGASLFYILRIALVGFGVIITFILMILPWIGDKHLLTSLVSAIFPVHRGLYQLKVANFWCFSNIFIKWTQIFDQKLIILMSIAFTLIACLPSIYVVFLRPKYKYLKLALFNISMSFFFFSYHVHEKTILIPLVLYVLCIRYMNIYYLDFVTISCLTLYPLLREDKQTLCWFVLTIVHHFFVRKTLKYLEVQGVVKKNLIDKCTLITDSKITDQPTSKKILEQEKDIPLLAKLISLTDLFYKSIFRKAIYILSLIAIIAENYVKPPANYPYLFSLIYAVLGFGLFTYVFIQTNLLMLHSYQISQKKKQKVD